MVAEVAVMHVIAIMATAAYSGRQHFFVHRFLVTRIAVVGGLFMRSVQLEVGFVVIEVPCLPITRVVASLAFRAQLALMHIFLVVARPAIRFRVLERCCGMTFLALYQRMSPK